MKKFAILDGSSLIYRAFYALPLLTDGSGEYTNAIVGFSNMLLRLLRDMQPDALAIAFDKGKRTFRTELFPDYKGTRKKTPEELSSQIPMLHELAEALGAAFIEKEGYEADDIIGTLSRQAADAGWDAAIVTGDRDALQLVRPGVRVMLTKKGISELAAYDEAAFRAEYGLDPIRLIDLKGLMGDSSDNIPGIPGIGPKTATKLLQAHGSLEEALARGPETAGKKLRESLLAYGEQARLSKQLATIDCQVPGIALADLDVAIHPDAGRLAEFCRHHGLRSLESKFRQAFSGTLDAMDAPDPAETAPAEMPEVSFSRISGEEELAPFREAHALAISPCFSSEEGERFPKWKGVAVAVLPDGPAAYVPEDAPAFSALLELLQDGRKVYALGLKELWHAGLRRQDGFCGLELAGYLLHPELSDYALPTLLEKELPGHVLSGTGESRAAAEALAVAKLGERLFSRLEQEGMARLYHEMELPLVSVLAEMEEAGIHVNREHLKGKAAETGERLLSIERDIYALAGSEFNINSPKQLGEILFERLHLPPAKKTKTGYSTNAEVLESLRFAHPIVESILSYRMLAKLKSTYLDAIEELISEETQRVHTSFNQTVTATGRLSSSDPNLQNIPVRTEEGRQIRALFEPGEGYDALLSADYSQIELRLLAHMSGDRGFIDAFLQGEDVHARTAAEVFGVPLDQVGADLRRKAKAVNFGIVYGISDYGLARDLHISRKEAGEYISRYFERYPGVRKFLDDTVAKARETGYVTTMFGRRRALPAIRSSNYNQRTLAERMAMNTPIQGTAADIIKLAMIAAHGKLKAAGLKSRILLQVHDELVLETVQEEIPQATEILRDAMERAADLSVPLAVDIHLGRNWAEAK